MRAGRKINMMSCIRRCICRRTCTSITAQADANASLPKVLHCDFGLFSGKSTGIAALDGGESFFLFCLEPGRARATSTTRRCENTTYLSGPGRHHDATTVSCRRLCDP
jgi:hypothetical protein